MAQQNRFKSLIISCICILAALAGIQIYLLQNTYKLSQASYRNATVTAFTKLEAKPQYKIVSDKLLSTLILTAKQVDSGIISQQDFLIRLKEADLLLISHLDSMRNIAGKSEPLLRLASAKFKYTYIRIASGGNSWDPIKKSEPPLLISAPNSENNTEVYVGNNFGSTDQSGKNGKLLIDYNLSKTLLIPNMPSTVVKELLLVGSLSMFLLLAVIILFYYVFKSAISQRKIAELRTDLVNNITHELKTPLSSMALAFKTLRRIDPHAPPSQQGDLIAAIERQHLKLSHTVERVLASAIEGQAEVGQSAVGDILKSYRERILPESHPLTISVESNPPVVNVSKGTIVAIIDNLVENAQKYTPEESPIHISGKMDGVQYRIDVIDAGDGISREFQKNLFEKFYRVPEQNRHTIKGLGLGLYLSREAIRRNGGDLQLTSATTAGCIFTLYLPIA